MYAPIISPHDPNVMFLAVDMSQILRTTDGGLHWTTLDSAYLQGKQLTEVQFTSTPNVLYSTDQRRKADESSLARPVKSTDNGTTWSTFTNWPSTRLALSTHASPLRDDTFLVCNGTKLYFYQSNTLTGSFATAYTFTGSTGRVAGVFWNGTTPGECWVGTNQGLLYSNDGGLTLAASVALPTTDAMLSFTGAKDPSTGLIRFHAVTTNTPVNQNTIANGSASGGTNRVWRLDWGGASPAWVDVTGAITGNFHATIVSMARNNADVLYVAANKTNTYPDNCTVFRSTTPGGAFTSIFTIPNNGNIVTGWGSENSRSTTGSRQFETAISYAAPCGLTVDPLHANRAVFCDNAVIHMSIDADAASPTWSQVYTAPDNTGHAAGQRFPTGQSYLSNGLEATVSLHLDWVNSTTLLGAFLDVKSPISTDGGQRWGFPYDHSTLAGGDINAVAHDPQTSICYAAAANTVSAYEYLGCDDAHTDINTFNGPTQGVYYQALGATAWQPLKTDLGVATGQRGGESCVAHL